jgi:hypothetical protein
MESIVFQMTHFCYGKEEVSQVLVGEESDFALLVDGT